MFRATFALLLLSLQVAPVLGQRPLPYPVTPPAEFQRAVERGTRTVTGEPGTAYWQQWTDYTLFASLDPTA